MEIKIELPDDLAESLKEQWGDNISRRILELAAVEGFRKEELTSYQVSQLLGFRTSLQTQAFLKKEGYESDYSLEDLEEDRETYRQLFEKKRHKEGSS